MCANIFECGFKRFCGVEGTGCEDIGFGQAFKIMRYLFDKAEDEGLLYLARKGEQVDFSDPAFGHFTQPSIMFRRLGLVASTHGFAVVSKLAESGNVHMIKNPERVGSNLAGVSKVGVSNYLCLLEKAVERKECPVLAGIVLGA